VYSFHICNFYCFTIVNEFPFTFVNSKIAMNYLDTFFRSYEQYKDPSLSGRYIHLKQIEPLVNRYKKIFQVKILGESVEGKPIYSLTLGNGSKKILMWSQMHGNESTTTKAVFDLLNYISAEKVIIDII